MENLGKTKQWTLVHRSREHDKFEGYKLLLSGQDWNDSGYYTTFRLFLQLPEQKVVNLKIAELNILNIGQQAGEQPGVSTAVPFFTFIRDIESAYMVLFHLTPEERRALIASLNIQFHFDAIKSEPAFRLSVLRGTDEISFKKRQEEIRRIVTCPLNISTALMDCKERMDLAFTR